MAFGRTEGGQGKNWKKEENWNRSTTTTPRNRAWRVSHHRPAARQVNALGGMAVFQYDGSWMSASQFFWSSNSTAWLAQSNKSRPEKEYFSPMTSVSIIIDHWFCLGQTPDHVALLCKGWSFLNARFYLATKFLFPGYREEPVLVSKCS